MGLRAIVIGIGVLLLAAIGWLGVRLGASMLGAAFGKAGGLRP